MHLVVLGATGATGLWLARLALDRGHTVVAVARRVDRLELPRSSRLTTVVGDVTQPESIERALLGADVVVSGLGVSKGGPHDLLTQGARAVIAAEPARIIWLGAFGTGRSAHAAGGLTRAILRVALAREVSDKVDADDAVLAARGVVVHAAALTNGPLAATWRATPLTDSTRRWLPPPISRATVAAVMLDEAEQDHYRGRIILPLGESSQRARKRHRDVLD